MRIASLLLSLLILYSCEESRTACLDFNAANYDFGAVSACDSCCVYPAFKASFHFHYDSISYHKDSLYFLNSSDSITIKSFKVAFSKFSFVNTLDTMTIIDSVVFDGQNYFDDFLTLRSTRTGTTVIGHTDYETNFDQLHLNFGFENSLENSGAIESFTEESNLAIALDSFYNEERKVLNMLGTTIELRDSIRRIELDNIPINDVVYNVSRELKAGLDWQVKFSIDLKVLFSGVHADMTDEELGAVVRSNLLSSVKLE